MAQAEPNDVERLAGLITQLANHQSESAQRELAYQERIMLCRTLAHAHHCAILALASTHPQKPKALAMLQRIWNTARGGLGTDGVSDAVRKETQDQRDQIAQALGGKIL